MRWLGALKLRCLLQWKWLKLLLASEISRCPSTVLCTVPSCESVNFQWIPSWELNWEGSSKGNLFVRVRLGGVPSMVEELVWVRLCCLLSSKTNTGNTGRTVFGHPPKKTLRGSFATYGIAMIKVGWVQGLLSLGPLPGRQFNWQLNRHFIW